MKIFRVKVQRKVEGSATLWKVEHFTVEAKSFQDVVAKVQKVPSETFEILSISIL